MTRNHSFLLALFALALLAALSPTPALAQTPDGETPAVEDVCDLHSGAAYGLCNAYCEAMDCHLGTDGDPTTEPSASEVACGKVLNRFMKLSGHTVLPCEEALASQ